MLSVDWSFNPVGEDDRRAPAAYYLPALLTTKLRPTIALWCG